MIKSLLNKLLSNPAAPAAATAPPIAQSNKIYLFESNQYELEKILESPDFPGKAPGYVYFVQEYMNGSFKIGKTKNVEKRMNVFGVKLPFENKLIYLIKSGNHHQTEAAFHKHFADKRLEGEWFALSKKDLAWIREGKYTSEINETIQTKETAAPAETQISSKEEKPLTDKQIELAKTFLAKIEDQYELVTEHSLLTQKDLNRLSVYSRYKNKGALNNLVTAGVLKEK